VLCSLTVFVISFFYRKGVGMLKRYSLFMVLFTAIYACSTYASDEAVNRFISSMARKLQFSGLVPGTTYQYKIMRNSMYRTLEITDAPLYHYYSTCSIFLYNSPASYPAEVYVFQYGKTGQSSINVDFNTFKLLLDFYNALPDKEVLDPEFYLTTYVKGGTFTYQE
jgi:hypothetical protein